MNTNELNKFFLCLEELKSIKRKGWEIKTNVNNVESVADHSYVATSIAMILSDLADLNTEKVVKMMLIHDLPEIIIGDLMPGENPNKSIEENIAINKILENLPENIRAEYIDIWNEFTNKQSKESMLVNEIDKLELIIQLSLYKNQMSKEVFNEFLQSAEKNIDSEFNRKLLKEILQSMR